MTKSKKIAAAIAAAAITTISSITAFATVTHHYTYDLEARQISPATTYTTSGTTLTFSTQPKGPGNVTVSVWGPALKYGSTGQDFPAQVQVSPLKVEVYDNMSYTFTVKANLTSASGTLNIENY